MHRQQAMYGIVRRNLVSRSFMLRPRFASIVLISCYPGIFFSFLWWEEVKTAIQHPSNTKTRISLHWSLLSNRLKSRNWVSIRKKKWSWPSKPLVGCSWRLAKTLWTSVSTCTRKTRVCCCSVISSSWISPDSLFVGGSLRRTASLSRCSSLEFHCFMHETTNKKVCSLGG